MTYCRKEIILDCDYHTGEVIKGRCGETGLWGEVEYCDECLAKYKRQYPQGWQHTPGDICKHGVYVGNKYDGDYMCGKCESGDK